MSYRVVQVFTIIDTLASSHEQKTSHFGLAIKHADQFRLLLVRILLQLGLALLTEAVRIGRH